MAVENQKARLGKGRMLLTAPLFLWYFPVFTKTTNVNARIIWDKNLNFCHAGSPYLGGKIKRILYILL